MMNSRPKFIHAPAEVTVVMEVETATEEVAVIERAPLVNTKSAVVRESMDLDMIMSLPLDDRDNPHNGLLGTVAGAFAGWADSMVMRGVDVMLSIPGILLAVSIAALFPQPGLYTVIIAVAMVQVPVFARLLRGSMLGQRASDHVLAARALGVKKSSIVFRHMLPNSLGPVIVQSTLVLALAIIDAAALSFLGLGNPDDNTPEWGQMLGNAQGVIDSHPHLAFWPAGCIIVVALGFTLVGESLRDALDPKNRR